MAKTISFSVVKILPSLLDRTKTQTIRPAWHNRLVYIEKGKPKSKPPRFKVGEPVKLYWKQRCKHKWYCRNCNYFKPLENSRCGNCGDTQLAFNKVLGESEITEVFKIRMGKNSSGYYLSYVEQPYTIGIALMYRIGSGTAEMMAERDGFESAEEMFKHFDEEYNLKEPKEFWVCRWKKLLTITQ